MKSMRIEATDGFVVSLSGEGGCNVEIVQETPENGKQTIYLAGHEIESLMEFFSYNFGD